MLLLLLLLPASFRCRPGRQGSDDQGPGGIGPPPAQPGAQCYAEERGGGHGQAGDGLPGPGGGRRAAPLRTPLVILRTETVVAVPACLTIISWIFISIGLLSAALILADIYLAGYREDVKIMDAVWPLTALYAGPIALAAYAAWGRPTSPKWLRARGRGGLSKPFWAGTAVSATHCGAGCVHGDLIAEWTVFAAGL